LFGIRPAASFLRFKCPSTLFSNCAVSLWHSTAVYSKQNCSRLQILMLVINKTTVLQ
jgi:hypothetical protein